MFGVFAGVITRILSNCSISVLQKLLTERKEKACVVSFFTYCGLTVLGLTIFRGCQYSQELLFNVLCIGILGATGNYFIVKALSCGEMSSIVPINAFKPIMGLILGILFLNEIPCAKEVIGIFMVVAGTLLLNKNGALINMASLYKFLGLTFSATEVIFIKKVILLTDINTAFFFWAVAGCLFSSFVAFKCPLKISKSNIGMQLLLVIAVFIMQYSTNYVLSKMNVALALALFQLSVVIGVVLGIIIFHEKDLLRKFISASIMISGAITIIV